MFINSGRLHGSIHACEEHIDPNVYFMQLKNKQQKIRKSSGESARRKIILYLTKKQMST